LTEWLIWMIQATIFKEGCTFKLFLMIQNASKIELELWLLP